jgi:peptidoglycan hydrolase-like protein with peptidoglycan-binding domain
VECGAGVTHSKTLNKKWEVWGVPACVEGDVPVPTPTPPTPTPTPDRPTLRRGSKGEYVTLLQTKLALLGYDLGKCGIDGDYGRSTESAVKAFQKDAGLSADGICGPRTWSALDETPKQTLYTVTIPHVTLSKAKELAEQYIGATYVAEE